MLLHVHVRQRPRALIGRGDAQRKERPLGVGPARKTSAASALACLRAARVAPTLPCPLLSTRPGRTRPPGCRAAARPQQRLGQALGQLQAP